MEGVVGVKHCDLGIDQESKMVEEMRGYCKGEGQLGAFKACDLWLSMSLGGAAVGT